MLYTYLESPVGRLLLAGDGRALTGVAFPDRDGPATPRRDWTRRPEGFADAIRQLEEYFGGRRREFDLPLEPRGTPFQRRVWDALREIPYGETRSYADIARSIGRPRAVRAVGTANGSNPLPIVIPCHRVVGSDGALTGFGGGLEVKRQLLRLEGALAVSSSLFG